MSIEQVMDIVTDFFTHTVKKPVKEVVGACKDEDGWTVDIEVFEEIEYNRRHGRNELLGVYRVQLNEDREIVCYQRTELRERGKLAGTPQTEPN
ncbi:gas vesicle protein GvpO [Calderihabitans maritimus]|nr:gas vesicle protein GvpO [Calderihabitans maritimus]